MTFGRARSFFTCDINVHAGRGLTLRGEGEAADAHAAFDDAAEHIAKRLRRYRRRVNGHSRDEAQGRVRPEMAREYILLENDDMVDTLEPVIDGHIPDRAYATVIADNPTEIAILTVGDAVMRMDLADQGVLMFRNQASENSTWCIAAPTGMWAGSTPPPFGTEPRAGAAFSTSRDAAAGDQCTSAGTISFWFTAATATSKSAASAIGVPSAAWMEKATTPFTVIGRT